MELFASQGRRFQPHFTGTPSRHALSDNVLLTDKDAARGGGGLGDLANLTSASALDNLDGVINTTPHQQQLLLLHALEGSGVEVSVDDDEDATGKVGTVPLPAWTAKYTLRSHFDAVRAVIFHHTDQLLLTGSEDCTLRLWSLAKRVQAKKSSCLDVEPVRNFISNRECDKGLQYRNLENKKRKSVGRELKASLTPI